MSEFATLRKHEADSGKLAARPDPGRSFSNQRFDEPDHGGFTLIRDQELLDDVDDWGERRASSCSKTTPSPAKHRGRGSQSVGFLR